jgi:hypothetical protein
VDPTANVSNLEKSPAAKVQIVANNTGGGVAGADSSTQPQVSSGGLNADGTQSPGSPGYNTQIDQGFRGASGSGSSSGVTVADNNDTYGGRLPNFRKTRRTASSSGFVGMDLRRYLPGGSQDGSRWRHLGGAGSSQNQINGRFVNMWTRISNKIQEKCRLGELLDCR